MTLDWLYNHNYNHPTPCGVYALVDVVADKVYVGSTVDLTRRATQHFRSLEEGVHHNRNLQYLWDVDGANSFSFVVLESIGDRMWLESREQVWLNRFRERALNRVMKVKRDDEWEIAHPADKVPLPWSDEAWEVDPNPSPVEDVLKVDEISSHDLPEIEAGKPEEGPDA
jgi:hypothetical protein